MPGLLVSALEFTVQWIQCMNCLLYTSKVLMGEFGQTIKPFNPEVQKKAIGDATPITCRPADLIEPQLELSLIHILKNMDRKFKRLIIKKEVIEDEQDSYCYRWKY